MTMLGPRPEADCTWKTRSRVPRVRSEVHEGQRGSSRRLGLVPIVSRLGGEKALSLKVWWRGEGETRFSRT